MKLKMHEFVGKLLFPMCKNVINKEFPKILIEIY